MAALDTVANYVADARVLLQDAVSPYRYPDADIVEALNQAMFEARRLRPDLFMVQMRTNAVTTYDPAAQSTTVSFDYRYRLAVLNFVVGYVQLRDDESTQDSRAVAFVQMFKQQLMGAA